MGGYEVTSKVKKEKEERERKRGREEIERKRDVVRTTKIHIFKYKCYGNSFCQ